jgi:hypothetical protein
MATAARIELANCAPLSTLLVIASVFWHDLALREIKEAHRKDDVMSAVGSRRTGLDPTNEGQADGAARASERAMSVRPMAECTPSPTPSWSGSVEDQGMNVRQDPHPGEANVPRPLLCAVDQSVEAREAAHVAASLAARLDAPLVLGHVFADRPAFPHGSLVEVERHRGDMLQTAGDLLERIASDNSPAHALRVRLAFGDPCEKIMALATTRTHRC